MRNITAVTNQILGILAEATIAPADQDNITTLQAELRVLLRRASYCAPEAAEALWVSLSQSCFRYLPPATGGYPQLISGAITTSVRRDLRPTAIGRAPVL